ncbi:hypothetical protein ACWDYJ_29820 [Streptomyces sp. NPDC003042]
MTNHPIAHREACLPWWAAISLVCAGGCAILLHRRVAAAAPSGPARRRSVSRVLLDDAASHLTTSW